MGDLLYVDVFIVIGSYLSRRHLLSLACRFKTYLECLGQFLEHRCFWQFLYLTLILLDDGFHVLCLVHNLCELMQMFFRHRL